MIICVKLFSVAVRKHRSKINSKGRGVIWAHGFKGSYARLGHHHYCESEKKRSGKNSKTRIEKRRKKLQRQNTLFKGILLVICLTNRP